MRTLLLPILTVSLAMIGGAAMAVEEPKFEIRLRDGAFEIRDYPALTAAEVVVSGSRDQASNDGFRLLAGYLLCRTGANSSPLYGAFADPRAPNIDSSAVNTSGVFYPVQGGIINTIQWEAVREGIDDVRYFGALKNYIRDLKDRQLRKDLTTESDNYAAAVLKKPLWTLSPLDYQKTRQGMINQTLKLLTAIRASVPTYPG